MSKMFWSEGWDVHDSYAWAFDSNYNILAKVDIEKREIVCVDSIPVCSQHDNRDFSCVYEFNGDVYLLPDKTNDIYIYSIREKKWEKIEMPHNESSDRIRAVWCGEYRDKLIVFASYQKSILYIDCNNKKIDECLSLNILDEVLADRDITMEGDELFFYSEESLKLYSYNLNNHGLASHEVSIKGDACRAMLKTGSKIWIYGGKRKIYCYDIASEEINQSIEIPFRYASSRDEEDNRQKIVTGFSGLIESYNMIWLIPCRADNIYVVDESSKEVKPFITDENMYYGTEISDSPLGSQFSINYYRDDRYIGLYAFKNRRYIEIDTKNRSWEYVDYKISGLECYRKMKKKQLIEKENGFMNLDLFLTTITE